MRHQPKFWSMLALMLITAVVLAACGGSPATPAPAAEPAEEEAPAAQEEAPAAEEAAVEEEAPAEEEAAPAAEGAIPLRMWYHGAGNDEERAVILQIIEDFNASQDEYVVEMQDFPPGQLQ